MYKSTSIEKKNAQHCLKNLFNKVTFLVIIFVSNDALSTPSDKMAIGEVVEKLSSLISFLNVGLGRVKVSENIRSCTHVFN